MRTPEEQHSFLETMATVLITLATVATAWCAFQSNIWSGVQEFELHDAAGISRQAAFYRMEANQQMTVDVQLFSEYVDATILGRDSIASFYLHRMPPRLRVAVQAWLARDPFKDTNAPLHPFAMKEYKRIDLARADSLDRVYEANMIQANDSNGNSDNYVLLTVLFASVMFFGGICSNIKSLSTKRAIIYVSTALLVGAVGWMLTFPISFS
ncbi:MAG: hypothetical protein JSS89_10875 [Bacteroidetes bacterium]|nr:hypothetical protein [Bacteroidota bacterium]